MTIGGTNHWGITHPLTNKLQQTKGPPPGYLNARGTVDGTILLYLTARKRGVDVNQIGLIIAVVHLFNASRCGYETVRSKFEPGRTADGGSAR
jgi:hypothetical protein